MEPGLEQQESADQMGVKVLKYRVAVRRASFDNFILSSIAATIWFAIAHFTAELLTHYVLAFKLKAL